MKAPIRRSKLVAPAWLVAKEGEGDDFLYRLPHGGMAVLAKIAWRGNKGEQRRFLKSCSHPTQISIEEFGRLHDAGGIDVYKQVNEWLMEQKAFVIEWLDNPLERENRDLSRRNNRLEAEKRKSDEDRRRGSATMKRKNQPHQEAIRGIVEKTRKLNPDLSRARLIKVVLEKSEKAGHKTSRATILRRASDLLPPLSKAKP